jgi:hypothetical protein
MISMKTSDKKAEEGVPIANAFVLDKKFVITGKSSFILLLSRNNLPINV